VEIAIAVAGRLLSTSTSGVRGKRPALIDRPMPIVTTRVATRRRSWWSWSWSPSPTAGLAQLLGQHLDGRAGAAVLSGPAPLLESAHDHDSAALRQGLRGVLGLVAPDDHGEERRLLLPPTGYRHPEHGPGDATLGVADLGLVGEVAGEADGCLGHGPALLGLSGRAVCPALGTGGRWTPWHAARPPGASGGVNEVGPTGSTADRWSARVPGWLAERLRLGVGHASTVLPDPSTLGVVGERGSRHEDCLQSVPGCLCTA
jgi:hypothetical protein